MCVSVIQSVRCLEGYVKNINKMMDLISGSIQHRDHACSYDTACQSHHSLLYWVMKYLQQTSPSLYIYIYCVCVVVSRVKVAPLFVCDMHALRECCVPGHLVLVIVMFIYMYMFIVLISLHTYLDSETIDRGSNG